MQISQSKVNQGFQQDFMEKGSLDVKNLACSKLVNLHGAWLMEV